MGRLTENSAGKNTDVSRAVQITSSPYSSNPTTVGTIPTTSDDNKITFSFDSETVPPSSIHIYAYDANLNLYVWTQIYTSAASLNTINQVTGTTQSSTPAPSGGGNRYTDTDLTTSFSSLAYSIELDSGTLGAANRSVGFDTYYGHYYLFFSFPS
jgi:hypothetical protein